MRAGWLACATGMVAGLASPAAAQQVRAAADATVSAGVSSNPFLVTGQDEDGGDDGASVFVEGVFSPRVTVVDERGSSSIGGYVRGTAYLGGGYDPTWAIGAYAQSQRAVTERLTLRGSVQVDSSIVGERFNTALLSGPVLPTDDVAAEPTQSGAQPVTTPAPTVNPLLPPQYIGPDITLLGLRRRQTTFSGSAGLSYQLSARDAVYADAQVQRSVTGGQFFSFSSYGGTVGYSRSLSERTQIGARLSGQWTDYDDGGSGEVYQPQLTIDTRLSPLWRLSGGVGLLFTKTRSIFGRDSSTGISGNVRLCRDGERSELCIYGARDAGPNGLGAVSRRLSAGALYTYRLGEDDSIRANVDYSRIQNDDSLRVPNQFVTNDDFSFFSVSAAYDRRLGRRFSAGVSASYRDSAGGFSDQSDLSASVYLSTRLGALR